MNSFGNFNLDFSEINMLSYYKIFIKIHNPLHPDLLRIKTGRQI